jgi:hypothetical protein
MPDQLPSGDMAVYIFLEMLALAFVFGAVDAFLSGKPWYISTGSLAVAILFFLAGIKWAKRSSLVVIAFLMSVIIGYGAYRYLGNANVGLPAVPKQSTQRPEPPKTDAPPSDTPFAKVDKPKTQKVVKGEPPSTTQLPGDTPNSQQKPEEKGNQQHGQITQGCGSIQQGGTGNQANVNCDYRDPLPPIDVTPSMPIAAGIEAALSAMTGERPNGPLIDKPGALVTITMKGAFRTPAFAADCDVPCALVSQLMVEGDRSRSLSSQFQILQRQDSMGALITYNIQMYPGSTIKITFRSLNDRPLTVLNVRAYDPNQK